MDDRVNILDMHLWRHGQVNGSIVQDRVYPGFDKLIGHFLGLCGWHCQHRNAQPGCLNTGDDIGNILNSVFADFLTNFCFVAVENHRHVKTAIGEALVASQGVPNIAGPDYHNIPDTVYPQDGAQLADQEFDAVSGALFAKLTELREIFADLGGGNSQPFPQFLRGGYLAAFLRHALQRAQVKGQSANDNIGDWFVFHFYLQGIWDNKPACAILHYNFTSISQPLPMV